MKKPRNANKNLKPNNCHDRTMAIVSSVLFCLLAVDISKLCTVTYQLANNKPDYIIIGFENYALEPKFLVKMSQNWKVFFY